MQFWPCYSTQKLHSAPLLRQYSCHLRLTRSHKLNQHFRQKPPVRWAVATNNWWPTFAFESHKFSSLTILLFMLDTLVPVTILLAVILLGNLTVVMGSNRGKQHFPHLWRVVAGALVALLMNHVRLMYPGEAQTIVVLWDRWFSYRSHQIQSGRGSNQTSTEGEKLPATRARKHPAVSRNILDKYFGYKRL